MTLGNIPNPNTKRFLEEGKTPQNKAIMRNKVWRVSEDIDGPSASSFRLDANSCPNKPDKQNF